MKDCNSCLCNTCSHESDRNYCGGCEQCEVENQNENVTNCLDYNKIN